MTSKKNFDISTLDMFGVPPLFKIQGNIKATSRFGLFLTLCTIIIVVLLLIFFGQNLYERKNPYFSKSDIPLASKDKLIELTPENFDIGFMIVSPLYGQILDPRIVQVDLVYSKVLPNGFTNDTILQLEPCERDFGIGKSNYVCLKQDQQILLGTVAANSAYLTLYAVRCDAFPGRPCFPGQMISDLVATAQLQLYQADFAANPSDYKNPFQKTFNKVLKQGVLNMTKTIEISLDDSIFRTDSGWLFESIQNSSRLTIGNIDLDVVFGPGAFFAVRWMTTGNQILFQRKYLKLQDLLAQIGGVISIILVVMRLVSKPYTTVKLYEPMINKLYSFDKKKNGGVSDANDLSTMNAKKVGSFQKIYSEKMVELPQSDSSEQKAAQNLGEQNNFNSDEKQTNGVDIPQTDLEAAKRPTKKQDPAFGEESEQILRDKKLPVNTTNQPKTKITQSSKEAVRLSFTKWIASLVKPTPISNTMMKGKLEIEKELDFLNMIKKFREFDRLKSLVLTNDQRILFDNLPGPSAEILDKGNPSDPNPVRDWYCSFEGEKDSEKAYLRIKNSEQKGEVDEKLLYWYEK